MSVESSQGDQTEVSRKATGGRAVARLFRLVFAIVVVGLLAAAAMVVPAWVPLWPRDVRRGLTEGFLLAVLAGYGGLCVVSLVAAPFMAAVLYRSRLKGRRRPVLERCLRVGASCLLSLVLLEVGSATWRWWMHRFPTLPTEFPTEQPDEFRIVVLGGSSALGEPYRPWLSVGQIVAWRLGEAIPARRFECEILAWLGDSLEQQHRKLAALSRRPGMVIIYSGHNEFAARYEEERDAWLDEEPRNRLIRPFHRASLYSPFCRLAYEVISRNRLDVAPPLRGRHQLIDPPQCSPAEAEEICVDFERRLEAIVAYCERIGSVPVLIIPPANEADYEPSRSTLRAEVSQEERASLVAEFTAARANESSAPEASAEIYRRILGRHPGFAEAHYRLAQLRERAGRLEEARRHYLAALDHDGLLIRCPATLRAAYERVAVRHQSSILIDGRAELAHASPRKLLDDYVIQDTHHPTLRGYVALAEAVLRELNRRQTFGAAPLLDGSLDAAVCADRFQMDTEKWATVCERASEHYRRVAGYRYDPADRLEKCRRYAKAAERIRHGVPPEKAGMPGIGARAPESAAVRGAEFDQERGVLMPEEGGNFAAARGRGSTESFLNPLDLPVLEQNRGAAAEESDGCREVIAVGTPDHLTDQAGERTVYDAYCGADWHSWLFGYNEARADHGVDLLEVAGQRPLVGDLEDRHDAVAAERDEAVGRTPLQKHVAGKERHDRLDPPSLGRAAFFSRLRKVVGDRRFAQLAGNGLLLAGFRVQAPPHGPAVGNRGGRALPEVRGVTIGLRRKNGHRIVGSWDPSGGRR
jgi:hypothetical protein